MGKISSILLGAISGATAAILLTTKKGKIVTEKVNDFVKEVQENPEAVKENVIQSATDFSNKAVDTVQQVKEKVENGDITTETVLENVRETTQEVLAFSQEKFNQIKEALVPSDEEEVEQETTTTTDSSDIIIDLVVDPQDSEETSEETPHEEQN